MIFTIIGLSVALKAQAVMRGNVLGISEVLLKIIWPMLSCKSRILITQKIEAFRARSLIQIPSSKVKVITFTPLSKNVFTDSLHFDSDYKAVHPSMSTISSALVLTCKNEERDLLSFLKSIEAQTYLPDRIIICDGGSSDSTLAIIEEWIRLWAEPKGVNVNLFSLPGASIALGRNEACKKTDEEILLFADMGTILSPDWADRILAPFVYDKSCEVSMGWYKPKWDKLWQYELSNLMGPILEKLNLNYFLPSARSLALKRSLFEEIGGFPEFLTFAAEDSLFDYYLKGKAKVIYFVPDAFVLWNISDSPIKLWNTIRRYARGDAETGFLFWSHYFSLFKYVLQFFCDVFFLLLLLSIAVLTGITPIYYLVILLSPLVVWRWISIMRENTVFSLDSSSEKGFSKPYRILLRIFAFHLLFSAQCVGFLMGFGKGRKQNVCSTPP